MLIGITSPRFQFGWNTDYAVQKSFVSPGIGHSLNFSFCGGLRYSSSIAFGKVLRRLGLTASMPLLSVDDLQGFKAFYCYGDVPTNLLTQLSNDDITAVLTTGVMTEHYMHKSGGYEKPTLQVEKLNDYLPAKVPFHFHSNFGMEQFLSVARGRRPAYAIPFYLPYLADWKPCQDPAKTLISFVGRDGLRKGLYLLLEALKLIPSSELSTLKTVLTVVSSSRPVSVDGLEIKWYKSASRARVRQLLCQTHIYAMAPLYESYGIVFVEAMAAGCAVIADNDYPRKEILSRTGIHVDSGTPNELAMRLRDLLHDRLRIQELGRRARERFEDHFSPTIVSAKYASMFLESIA